VWGKGIGVPAHQRNRSWAREHPGQRDEAWFKREIGPKVDAVSLKEIAQATGWCEAAAFPALGCPAQACELVALAFLG
jgi:hypothetical protein